MWLITWTWYHCEWNFSLVKTWLFTMRELYGPALKTPPPLWSPCRHPHGDSRYLTLSSNSSAVNFHQLRTLALVVVVKLIFYYKVYSSSIHTNTKNHVTNTSLLTTQLNQILTFCSTCTNSFFTNGNVADAVSWSSQSIVNLIPLLSKGSSVLILAFIIVMHAFICSLRTCVSINSIYYCFISF